MIADPDVLSLPAHRITLRYDWLFLDRLDTTLRERKEKGYRIVGSPEMHIYDPEGRFEVVPGAEVK